MITAEFVARLSDIISVISKDVKTAFTHNITAVLTIALITAIACLFILAYNKKLHRGKGRLAFPFYSMSLILFIPYIYSIFQIAFFSRELGSRSAEKAEFMPFVTWGRTAVTNAYVVENILFFIPLGLLLPIVTHKKMGFFNTVFFGALFSLSIETMQLYTGRGYFQTDDIMMNTIGTVIGAAIYLTLRIVINAFILPVTPKTTSLTYHEQ